MNDRALALDVLTLIAQKKGSIQSYNKPLSPYARELIFGVCRYYFYLESLAKTLVPKKPKDQKIWLTLLLGLYQLHYLKQAEYAVVKETVELTRSNWARGFINAVLRNYCRKKPSPPVHLNHPDWFARRIQQAWPQHWQNILEENDIHPPMTLRVNTSAINIDAYLLKLQNVGISGQKMLYAKEAILLDTPCHVTDLPGFADGLCAVQDAAAQLAAHLLDLKPGDRILDACAAPGGKTCHILEKEPHLDQCIALDIDEKRLQKVAENLSRLKLEATLKQGDAATPETWWDGVAFDKILLDAPCSATGVIRRHPDIKLMRTEMDVAEIVKLQAKILQALWPLLSPGGRLVYATCSVLPEENELQIANFLKTQKDAQLESIDIPFGHKTPHGRQIFPGQDHMDGFFYSVISKAKTR